MRFVVARRLGRRGEGLGNEMIAWSKGFIACQVLQARLIGPSWGLNKRKYYRNFGTSRLDFLVEELLVCLPHYRFTEADYINSGEVDFGRAISGWARHKGLLNRSSYIVIVDGMYGGYASIGAARFFLLARLLNSRDALANIFKVSSQLDHRKLFIAVHMRFGGDFVRLAAGESARGRFNILTPLGWYLNICGRLQKEFGDRVQFYFFTDRGGPEFEEAVQRFNPEQIRQPGISECSDLLLMARADLRICSISSYSLVASFLGEGPYAWYEPQLTLEDSTYTLWGHELNQRKPGSVTMKAIEEAQELSFGADSACDFKGYPVLMDEVLPDGLVTQLRHKLAMKNPALNLLDFGAVPKWIVTK